MSDPSYPPADPPPQYEPPKGPPGAPPPGGYPAAGTNPPGPQPMGYAPPPAGYPQQPPMHPYPTQHPAPQGYPQPGHPQYPQAVPGGVTTTIIAPAVTTFVGPVRFGEAPVVMQCPYCSSQVTTSTNYKIGMFTWMVVGIMALIGLFFFPPIWLCCCIPCCIPACKDVDHSCPNCNKFVGHYSRMH